MSHKTKIRQATQRLRHVFPLVLVIVGMLALAGSFTKVFQQNTNPSTYTPLPTPLPHTTYTSSKLGISFDYIPVFPNGIGQYFFTKEIGDTVYLYWVPGANQPFSGSDPEFLQTIAPGSKFVEVFNKDPQQSLTGAIKQQFLTGYAESDCFVNIQRYSRPIAEEAYQTAIIDFPHKAGHQTRKQLEALVAKCPSHVNSFDFIRYFIMDPKHPDKLLFVTIGQDNLPSGVGGSTWDKTLKVLQ